MVRKEKATQGCWNTGNHTGLFSQGCNASLDKGRTQRRGRLTTPGSGNNPRTPMHGPEDSGSRRDPRIQSSDGHGNTKATLAWNSQALGNEVGNLDSVKDIAMTATRTNIDEVSTGGKPSGKKFPVEKVEPVANMGEATRLELKLESNVGLPLVTRGNTETHRHHKMKTNYQRTSPSKFPDVQMKSMG